MHKHWKSICAVENINLRCALITIDLASEEALKLARGFPECFSSTESEDLVPFGVVMEVAKDELAKDPDASTLNVERACEKLSIPYVLYAITKNKFCEGDDDLYAGYVTRAWHRVHSKKPGMTVILDENEYVVLDTRYDELTLASTKRVAV